VISEKACTVCKQFRPLSDYSVNRARKDGLHYVCRGCVRLKDAAYTDRKNELRRQRAAENASKALDPSLLKRCNRCHNEQPHTAFYRANREVDGLQSYCQSCCSQIGREYREAHPDRDRARHIAYRNANRERVDAKTAAWSRANPEKRRAISKRFFDRNTERERMRRRDVYRRTATKRRAAARRWRIENAAHRANYERNYLLTHRHLVNAKTARRRAAKKSATPCWADQGKILEFYKEAARLTKALGVPYHVDHIVPLVSKLVCGLHVEANLQVITGSENSQKNNSFWPDMPT
jgi:hypothetical protein